MWATARGVLVLALVNSFLRQNFKVSLHFLKERQFRAVALESPLLFPQTLVSVRSPQKYVSQKGEEAEGLRGPAVPLAACGLGCISLGSPEQSPGKFQAPLLSGDFPGSSLWCVPGRKGGFQHPPAPRSHNGTAAPSPPAAVPATQPQLRRPCPSWEPVQHRLCVQQGSGCPGAAAPRGQLPVPREPAVPTVPLPTRSPSGLQPPSGGLCAGAAAGPRALDSPLPSFPKSDLLEGTSGPRGALRADTERQRRGRGFLGPALAREVPREALSAPGQAAGGPGAPCPSRRGHGTGGSPRRGGRGAPGSGRAALGPGEASGWAGGCRGRGAGAGAPGAAARHRDRRGGRGERAVPAGSPQRGVAPRPARGDAVGDGVGAGPAAALPAPPRGTPEPRSAGLQLPACLAGRPRRVPGAGRGGRRGPARKMAAGPVP